MSDNLLERFLAKRGIPMELAQERGYTLWTPETGADVIGEAFPGLHTGGLEWLQGIASEPENGGGFTIPRRPVPLPEGIAPLGPIFPEIKTGAPVKTSTTRHYHGDMLETFEDLVRVLGVNHVESVLGVPKMGFVRIYFTHHHSTFDGDGEGLLAHGMQWHSYIDHDGVRRVRGRRVSHRHSVMVFLPRVMRFHIANAGGKFTNAHVGVNLNEIHTHTGEAKYLLPPHPSEDRPDWGTTLHDHDDMTEDELREHLATEHANDLPINDHDHQPGTLQAGDEN